MIFKTHEAGKGTRTEGEGSAAGLSTLSPRSKVRLLVISGWGAMGLFWKTEEKWKWGLCLGRVLFVLRGTTLCICTLRGHCIVWGDRSCQSRVNWRLKGPPGRSGCTGLWRVHISRAENGARLGGTHSTGVGRRLVMNHLLWWVTWEKIKPDIWFHAFEPKPSVSIRLSTWMT